MSEKESAFIRELKIWIITGVIGALATGLLIAFSFYFTTTLRLQNLESADKELKEQHIKDIKDIKDNIQDINNYLRDKK